MSDQTAPHPEAQPDASLPESPREDVGFGGRFAAIWADPAKVFRNLTGKFDWVIILLLMIVIAVGASVMLKPIIIAEQVQAVEDRLDEQEVPREQQEEILEGMRAGMDSPFFYLFAPIYYVIRLFVVAAVILFVGNILLDGSGRYGKYLNAFSWSSLVVIPETIIGVPLALKKESIQVSLGLGALVTREGAGPFLHTLLSKIEIFTIWQIALLAIGVGIIANAPAKKAAIWIVVIWLAWVLIQAGFSTLGMMFGA